MNHIEVSSLKKHYGDIKAVDGVSLTVKEGEVFALLGPNGAGKTTAIEIMEGLREKDSGEVNVLGLDPWKMAMNSTENRSHTAAVYVLRKNHSKRGHSILRRSLRCKSKPRRNLKRSPPGRFSQKSLRKPLRRTKTENGTGASTGKYA